MSNRVILVTGASRGIGKEIAIRLSKLDNIVIGTYKEAFEETVKIQEELGKENKNIEFLKLDVSKKEEIYRTINYILEKYKKIDVLINNAGISQTKLFTEITEEDWNNMININLNSVFYITQEVVKNMIQNKSGLIINISSIWGQTGASCESHYAVAKAGVDALTKSLAKELGLSNIRINSIAPGIIDTDMNAHLTEQERKEILEEIPLERIGKPEDISKCVEWLIDDNYVTGQIIPINGGWFI